MKSDVVIIGGGASGLMAAYGAASTFSKAGESRQVILLEKMPRPARKIMITGKGRCNFTNLKSWNDFQGHIRSKANFVKPSFFNLNPQALVDFFESNGMPAVIERGDRAFPSSYHASDVVDTLVRAAQGEGVKILTGWEVSEIKRTETGFEIDSVDGQSVTCSSVIVATGGLSYPTTGSTGDGYRWAENLGHKIVPTFPSLTALVPKGYKDSAVKGHIDRSTPLSEAGKLLCGIQLKNVGIKAEIDGFVAEDEFGDIDFTDGGIEGPIGFQISRKCVKSMINGSKVSVFVDLKPGVPEDELHDRIKFLWDQVQRDPRSSRISVKEQYRVLLGKLMPWDLIPSFRTSLPVVDNKHTHIDFRLLAKTLKAWKFEIAGFVGYERAVVTAGGVSTDEVLPKTMESRLVPGLFFCGEVLDTDCDTGGYNLQTSFCSGLLAGQSAARKLL